MAASSENPLKTINSPCSAPERCEDPGEKNNSKKNTITKKLYLSLSLDVRVELVRSSCNPSRGEALKNPITIYIHMCICGCITITYIYCIQIYIER